MIYETRINLRNKTKEELILFVNEGLETIRKYEAELEKKEAIINEMAKELSKLNYLQYCNENNCAYPPCNKERCIKQYFTNKVEREGK